MKITVVGGTGFIGRHLCHELLQREHDVVVLTRDVSSSANAGTLPPQILLEKWDYQNLESLKNTLSGSDAVVNLAGAPIAEGRWTPSRKTILRASRIETTRMIVNTLANVPVPARPKVLINASGIGYYGINELSDVDEKTKPGKGFLAELCVEWEREAFRATEYGLRTVSLRTSMVLGQDGGALPKMLLPFKLFIGGPIGDGNQPVSWIHVEDHVRLIATILEHHSFKGPINAVSPNAVTMKEFCKELGKAMGRPSWIPVPAFVLKVGLGELSTLMTHGQRVHSCVIQELGFTFNYPDLRTALSAILAR